MRRGFRLPARLIAAVIIAGAVGLGAGPAGASTSAAPDPSASTTAALGDDPAWKAADVADLLRDDDVVVLPGSIARFDEEQVRGFLAGTGIKLLVVPPGPLDSDENRAYADRVNEVDDLLRTEDAAATETDQEPPELITVTGLSISMGILGVGPDDLASLRFDLETYDITDSLEFAVRYMVDGTELDSDPPPVTVVTDQAVVADLASRLRSDRVVVDDSVDYQPAASMLTRFEETTGETARVVVLPPRELDENPDVAAADLAEAFPDDVVVLFRGRWFEVAGPGAEGDPGTAEFAQARNMVLSEYESFLLGRDIGPDNVMRTLADSYAELTSGTVTDQVVPAQRNPLRWLLAVLPVLAVVLIVAFAVRHNRRRGQVTATVRHRSVADLGAAAAALPALAAGILAVDGLSQEGRAAELVDRAVERYRAAWDLVRDRQADPAWAAIEESRAALAAAAAELDLPHVPGVGAQT